MPLHYWRIHARVTRRLWSDIPNGLRDTIANDTSHETEAYKWFTNKVATDTRRLFEDPSYYDNALFTFQHSAREAAWSPYEEVRMAA